MDGKPKMTSFWVLKLLKCPCYNKKELKKKPKKMSFCCTGEKQNPHFFPFLPRTCSFNLSHCKSATLNCNPSSPVFFQSYAASKAEVETMTKIVAKELKGTGVTANAVAPGPMATGLFFEGKYEEMIKMIADAYPLSRLGEPKDVTHLLDFLATNPGEWING
jgi:NAD(P)-dependent dehydrogenase (short-subunit alcohol dehydrogenase family)